MYLNFLAAIIIDLVFHKANESVGLCFLNLLKVSLFFLGMLVGGLGERLLIS